MNLRAQSSRPENPSDGRAKRRVFAVLRKPATKYALVAASLVAVIAAAAFVYVNRPINVQVAAIEQNVPVRVFGLGTTEARVLSKIGFEVGATLAELHADHGDRVSKARCWLGWLWANRMPRLPRRARHF